MWLVGQPTRVNKNDFQINSNGIYNILAIISQITNFIIEKLNLNFCESIQNYRFRKLNKYIVFTSSSLIKSLKFIIIFRLVSKNILLRVLCEFQRREMGEEEGGSTIAKKETVSNIKFREN